MCNSLNSTLRTALMSRHLSATAQHSGPEFPGVAHLTPLTSSDSNACEVKSGLFTHNAWAATQCCKSLFLGNQPFDSRCISEHASTTRCRGFFDHRL